MHTQVAGFFGVFLLQHNQTDSLKQRQAYEGVAAGKQENGVACRGASVGLYLGCS